MFWKPHIKNTICLCNLFLFLWHPEKKMPAQEFYVEGIIQINITICNPGGKSFLPTVHKYQLKGFAFALLKFQACMGSQRILISHLIWKGFYEHESLCSVFGARVEVSAVPCAEVWLFFWLGWNDQGDNNGVVEFRVGWETLRSTVHHQTCCCLRDNSTLVA